MVQPRNGRHDHPSMGTKKTSNLPHLQGTNEIEITTELAHTGVEVLPSTPPPATLHAAPLTLDQEKKLPKGVDSFVKSHKPIGGRGKQGQSQTGQSSIASMIDVQSSRPLIKTEAVGVDDADDGINTASKGRRRGGGMGRGMGRGVGRGVGRGMGRGRGRGGAKQGAIEVV